MAYAAGVDVGSTQTKAVIIDEDGAIVGRALIDTGANVIARRRERLTREALETPASRKRRSATSSAPGYGRYRVTFGNTQVTEISCHGRGAVHMFPGTRTVVDMGGQDTKAIRVSPTGEILDFCMNDKCAAGTGPFPRRRRGGARHSAGRARRRSRCASDKPVKISTTCTVFAESEVLSWLGRGKKVEDILLGVHRSIVSRSLGLMRRVGVEPRGDLHRRSHQEHRHGAGAERGARLRRSTSARSRTSWARSARRSSRATTS